MWVSCQCQCECHVSVSVGINVSVHVSVMSVPMWVSCQCQCQCHVGVNVNVHVYSPHLLRISLGVFFSHCMGGFCVYAAFLLVFFSLTAWVVSACMQHFSWCFFLSLHGWFQRVYSVFLLVFFSHCMGGFCVYAAFLCDPTNGGEAYSFTTDEYGIFN